MFINHYKGISFSVLFHTFSMRLCPLNWIHNDEAGGYGGVLLLDWETKLRTDTFNVVAGLVENKGNVALRLISTAILNAFRQSLQVRILGVVARIGFACDRERESGIR